MIARQGEIQALADDYRHAENRFFIGGASTGALAGRFPETQGNFVNPLGGLRCGELKHGAISLITPGMRSSRWRGRAAVPETPVGVKEVKARARGSS